MPQAQWHDGNPFTTGHSIAFLTPPLITAYRGFCLPSGWAKLALSKKQGEEIIKQILSSLHLLHSIYSQANFFCYKILKYSRTPCDFVGGDWRLYFSKDLVFPQKHCQVRQSLTFWGNESRWLRDRTETTGAGANEFLVCPSCVRLRLSIRSYLCLVNKWKHFNKTFHR